MINAKHCLELAVSHILHHMFATPQHPGAETTASLVVLETALLYHVPQIKTNAGLFTLERLVSWSWQAPGPNRSFRQRVLSRIDPLTIQAPDPKFDEIEALRRAGSERPHVYTGLEDTNPLDHKSGSLRGSRLRRPPANVAPNH